MTFIFRSILIPCLIVAQHHGVVSLVLKPSHSEYFQSSIQQYQKDTLSSFTYGNTKTSLSMAPGGWGIGTPKDMQDEEFNSRARRRRRRSDDSSSSSSSGVSSSKDLDEIAYNPNTMGGGSRYELQDSLQFSQRVSMERKKLQDQKKKDLMEIAKIAGLSMKPRVNSESASGKSDSERLGRFDADLMDDDDVLNVRVEWDDSEK